MLLVIGGLAMLSHHYTLSGIKARTVGDGQHGTARWATKKEIQQTYAHVPFKVNEWRQGINLPTTQGLVLGCTGKKNEVRGICPEPIRVQRIQDQKFVLLANSI